jgi:putative transposase
MPRVARVVCAGLPHHVTQRGNRRNPVFFDDGDRLAYLALLSDYSNRHAVEVLAYCLMTNHVHLVLRPATAEALRCALRPLHMRHTQRVNRRHDWKGHLWQGRYFSSPLDEDYLWAAIRYVELNPVRACLVDRAEEYPWSSASAHCGVTNDPVLTSDEAWRIRLAAIGDWSTWLVAGGDDRSIDVLRRHADKGIPCGSTQFVEELERATGRALRARPQGRPPA